MLLDNFQKNILKIYIYILHILSMFVHLYNTFYKCIVFCTNDF